MVALLRLQNPCSYTMDENDEYFFVSHRVHLLLPPSNSGAFCVLAIDVFNVDALPSHVYGMKYNQLMYPHEGQLL